MFSSRLYTSQDAIAHFNNYFEKYRNKTGLKNLPAVRISCEKLDIQYSFPPADQEKPFHIASIGKVFTATLVHLLAERSVISTGDPVSKFLSPQVLDGLFTYKGHDHARQVTVDHLLGHTSGIADYFEGKSSKGISFLDELLSETDHPWTPLELVDYTRRYQSPVGIPGGQFNYSDTGYILLGLLIEKVTGKSFHQNLHDEFFDPLNMDDSYLMFYSQPRNHSSQPIEKIWLKGKEVSEYRSLSADWAGGGIVSTCSDLQKFHQSLQEGRIIQKSTLQKMRIFPNKFRQGIHYGSGMMEIRFAEFFFLLRNLPHLTGHIGILATHMFHDPILDAYITMNFASAAKMVDSFKALIEIETRLHRIRF